MMPPRDASNALRRAQNEAGRRAHVTSKGESDVVLTRSCAIEAAKVEQPTWADRHSERSTHSAPPPPPGRHLAPRVVGPLGEGQVGRLLEAVVGVEGARKGVRRHCRGPWGAGEGGGRGRASRHRHRHRHRGARSGRTSRPTWQPARTLSARLAVVHSRCLPPSLPSFKAVPLPPHRCGRCAGRGSRCRPPPAPAT